jgi:hypothetical protein
MNNLTPLASRLAKLDRFMKSQRSKFREDNYEGAEVLMETAVKINYYLDAAFFEVKNTGAVNGSADTNNYHANIEYAFLIECIESGLGRAIPSRMVRGIVRLLNSKRDAAKRIFGDVPCWEAIA